MVRCLKAIHVFSIISLLSACNSNANIGKNFDGIGGSDIFGGRTSLDSNDKNPVGERCKSNDSKHICLGLKYVVYKKKSGEPVLSKSEVIKNMESINRLWKQCNIGFQIDEYVEATPKENHLRFHPADDSELTDIRQRFQNQSTLLVVTTGSWNREGSLGNTGANAWATMPGEDPSGVVLEGPVGTFGNIVAHELGHMLSLDHAGDSAQLMNPIIYDTSETLTEDECSAARSTAKTFWHDMTR